jgi:hypothetical protein
MVLPENQPISTADDLSVRPGFGNRGGALGFEVNAN